MSEDVMLKEALDAVRRGQRARARDLLTRLLRADQSNPEYWLWMSSLVESLKEQVYCLQSALKLDPQNQAARQGLVLLGALPPDPSIRPAPLIRRQWEVLLQPIPKTRRMDNPIWRIAVYSSICLLVLAGLIIGASGYTVHRLANQAIIPTSTAGPSPTYTNTPTYSNFTPLAPTTTPRLTGPPPLWTLLDSTYTPTPNYIGTPHPINEAFRVGQRALSKNNLDAALENLTQAILIEPEAADLQYTIGEIYYSREEYIEALSAFEKSIAIDEQFAPAYLGRARTLTALDPQAEVLEDLERAVDLDPHYPQARLDLVDYLLSRGDLKAAAEQLEHIEDLLPDSPLLHLYRARVFLEEGEGEQALESARLANQLDRTLLESYRILGQAAALNGQYPEAFEALDTYLQYEQRDTAAWILYGEALFATSQYSDTLQAMETALDLDPELSDAYFYKGLVYIELGQGQKAVNDIYRAVKLKPNTFDYQLNFARALFVADRVEQAVGAMYPVERLASDDKDLAQVYYWRALMLEANNEILLAQKDWHKLLGLDEEFVPQDWREVAQEHIAKTATPSPTSTPSKAPSATPTSSKTPVPTRSATSTPKPTPTPSSSSS